MIRTVNGDIASESITGAYMHEHLVIDSNIVRKQMPHIFLESVDAAITEVSACKENSINLFLDCMPRESGQNITKLREISSRAGVHIVASAGMHNPKYYASDSIYLSANRERYFDLIVEDITQRNCGVIKIHTVDTKPNQREIELFAGAVQAQKTTGAPILTHCENGLGAIQQIELLNSLGADLRHVVLSHTDKESDRTYHHEILDSGINVEYDQCLRQLDMVDKQSLLLTIEMCTAGYDSQIMLGTDGARRSLWKSLGGSPGLQALSCDWRTLLKEAGLSLEVLELLFKVNPQRFLTFSEPQP